MEQTEIRPRKVETTVLARCAHCKQPLYIETIIEERPDGGDELVETGRVSDGEPDLLVCDCRKEADDG